MAVHSTFPHRSTKRGLAVLITVATFVALMLTPPFRASTPTTEHARRPSQTAGRLSGLQPEWEHPTTHTTASLLLQPQTLTRDQLAACFRAAEGVQAGDGGGVHLLAYGDSHARDIVRSVFDRGDTKPRTRRPGDLPKNQTFRPAPGRSAGPRNPTDPKDYQTPPSVGAGGAYVAQIYSGAMADWVLPASVWRPSTHVLVSRGVWDTAAYGTSLIDMDAAFGRLLESSANVTTHGMSPRSIVFKSLHYLHEPKESVLHFAGCYVPRVSAAVRRIGACAVSRHNHRHPSMKITLFDAYEAVQRLPRAALSDDGHHLVGGYLHAIADQYLTRVVCPSIAENSTEKLPPPMPTVLITDNETVIDERFQCAELRHTIQRAASHSLQAAPFVVDQPPRCPTNGAAAPTTASLRLHLDERGFPVVNRSGSLEEYFGLGPRLACRCASHTGTRNDQCTFAKWLTALVSRKTSFFYEPSFNAWRIFRHICDLGEVLHVVRGKRPVRFSRSGFTATPTSLDRHLIKAAALSSVDRWWEGNVSSAARSAIEDLSDIVLEVCVEPQAALRCMLNRGYVPEYPGVTPDGRLAKYDDRLPRVAGADELAVCRCSTPDQLVNRSEWCLQRDAKLHGIRSDLYALLRPLSNGQPLRRSRATGAPLLECHRKAHDLATLRVLCSADWQAAAQKTSAPWSPLKELALRTVNKAVQTTFRTYYEYSPSNPCSLLDVAPISPIESTGTPYTETEIRRIASRYRGSESLCVCHRHPQGVGSW